MHADREHHHDMYVGVEFKFEKHHALSPFRIGRDSLFEFSGGPPSQVHSTHFTLVVSEVSALHQSVLELVPHALAVICGLEA